MYKDYLPTAEKNYIGLSGKISPVESIPITQPVQAAFQNVKRLQRTAARKKSSEKILEEKPIVAPVEDASGYSPRAAVGTSEQVH
jgi:hypothetical protein